MAAPAVAAANSARAASRPVRVADGWLTPAVISKYLGHASMSPACCCLLEQCTFSERPYVCPLSTSLQQLLLSCPLLTRAGLPIVPPSPPSSPHRSCLRCFSSTHTWAPSVALAGVEIETGASSPPQPAQIVTIRTPASVRFAQHNKLALPR